ncbi:MAG: MBL fold metallo-hydrolase [Rheinheimera sp.]|nr:MBL fold metallo-hydrolase [Rheinheimera sp.]
MLQAIAIPILQDNYIWLIRQADSNAVIAVDPGSSTELSQYLHKHELELTKILITHQHADHIDGLSDLKQQWPSAEVLVPALPFPWRITQRYCMSRRRSFNVSR